MWEKRWGQEFKHYTLSTKQKWEVGKKNVHKGDAICRLFCLCLGVSVARVYLHHYPLLTGYAQDSEMAPRRLSVDLTHSPWMEPNCRSQDRRCQTQAMVGHGGKLLWRHGRRELVETAVGGWRQRWQGVAFCHLQIWNSDEISDWT